ncbi:hypothetical protein AZE42_11765 [Rhizopogon vesiculosus]|uniref:Uncharacterized protein n=1 Tax=Rhizopogon vesiculosus TaxID=180088 RepID=A0A1J8PUJ7_9AGAM|nr:hypothetical protein AZE42_11765 [Rhizopogon vesiculosus]
MSPRWRLERLDEPHQACAFIYTHGLLPLDLYNMKYRTLITFAESS